MDQLVGDVILKLGLALPLAILVGIGAGKTIHTINSLNMETQITHLAVDVVKDQIVDQLAILLRVYRDTTVDGNLPAAVNLRQVSERVLFSVDNIHWLNQIYLDLVNQGTQCEPFLQILKFLGG